MTYDAVIVGGGIAGLTAAAYLCKSGYEVAVCEKEKRVGGLVNSFDYKGFTFDGGIRAIENSGIVMPMLRQLGLDVDFTENTVSIGIGKEVIHIVSKESLLDYQSLLLKQFPGNSEDINKIIDDIRRIMGYMDVLYGIDNPLFMDLKNDKEYLFKTILPWLFKYITTFNKIQKLDAPVDEYLRQFTGNHALVDVIAQHFFRKTPASFALSYFSLYLDYRYPKGGTGSLIDALEKFISNLNGEIHRESEICHVNPGERYILDAQDNRYNYRYLIWAADLKKMYQLMDFKTISNKKIKQQAMKRKNAIMDKTGGDSVLTLYATVDLDKSFFESICSPHFFYTPSARGLSGADFATLTERAGGQPGYPADKQVIIDWMNSFYNLTTYEISIPVMRDENLAPAGKTGIIISVLFDFTFVKHIAEMGWYDEFKDITGQLIIGVLDSTIFPGLKDKVIDRFVSTPLTMEKKTGNSEGAITGWAFTNSMIPAIKSTTKITRAVLTPVPDIFQAGQWTFSPSGLPMSILTGKLAADKARSKLKTGAR